MAESTRVDGALPQPHTIEIDSTASLDKPGVGAPDGKDADFDTAISTPLIRAAAILTEITRHGRYKLRRRDNAIAFYEVGKLLSGVKKNVERGHFSHTLTSRNISPDTSKFAIRVYESLESIENAACLCTGSVCLDTVLQLRPPFAWHRPDGLQGVT